VQGERAGPDIHDSVPHQVIIGLRPFVHLELEQPLQRDLGAAHPLQTLRTEEARRGAVVRDTRETHERHMRDT